jgi:protein SCO1/2
MTNKTKKSIYVAGFFVVLIGIFYVFTYSDVSKARPPLPVLGNPGHTVGAFAFVDQQGDTVTQNNLNGKVSVVEYYFTRCTNLCPKMNKNMDKIYEDFKDTADFQILSNTVDPAHDSVPVLAKYAEQWGANPKVWKFLTGPRDELFDVAIHQYLLSVADSEHVTDQFVHTQYFALVDQHRRIRGFYDGLKPDDMAKLKTDIRRLLKAD